MHEESYFRKVELPFHQSRRRIQQKRYNTWVHCKSQQAWLSAIVMSCGNQTRKQDNYCGDIGQNNGLKRKKIFQGTKGAESAWQCSKLSSFKPVPAVHSGTRHPFHICVDLRCSRQPMSLNRNPTDNARNWQRTRKVQVYGSITDQEHAQQLDKGTFITTEYVLINIKACEHWDII